MDIKSSLIYFLTGGLVTLLIVGLEKSGLRTWSGLATLMPVFTLVAYLFIGNTRGGEALAAHAKFVLVGTAVAWAPYMLVVILLAPRLGAYKAIAAALSVFFIFALSFIAVVRRFGLFQ